MHIMQATAKSISFITLIRPDLIQPVFCRRCDQINYIRKFNGQE